MQILNFKYNQSPSKQNQFIPVYQTLSYLRFFFVGQLLLLTSRIVFIVSFGPFFDLLRLVASAKISQEEKNTMSTSNYMCIPKIMIFRCFVG